MHVQSAHTTGRDFLAWLGQTIMVQNKSSHRVQVVFRDASAYVLTNLDAKLSATVQGGFEVGVNAGWNFLKFDDIIRHVVVEAGQTASIGSVAPTPGAVLMSIRASDQDAWHCFNMRVSKGMKVRVSGATETFESILQSARAIRDQMREAEAAALPVVT